MTMMIGDGDDAPDQLHAIGDDDDDGEEQEAEETNDKQKEWDSSRKVVAEEHKVEKPNAEAESEKREKAAAAENAVNGIMSHNKSQSGKLQKNRQKLTTGCGGGDQAKRLLRLVGPQLAVVALFIGYLLLGTLGFQLLDEQLARESFSEIVLFCFETLATIGYGNICPTSLGARLFTMGYVLLGIPLCMLTLANLGKHLTKAYAALAHSLRHKELCPAIGQIRLPLPVLVLLFCVCFFATTQLLSIPAAASSSNSFSFYSDHLYYSVISFTTIGFGDLFPTTGCNCVRLVLILCHLSLGLIVWGIWFHLVGDWMQRMFRFKHRRFRHARDIQVWFGRKQMRLSSVLESVAREFEAEPAQIHQVLNDLDFLISDALDTAKKKSPSMGKIDTRTAITKMATEAEDCKA